MNSTLEYNTDQVSGASQVSTGVAHAQPTWRLLADALTKSRGESARLRAQLHRARARFMDSLANGEGDANAAEAYTQAVTKYRVAIFSEIETLKANPEEDAGR